MKGVLRVFAVDPGAERCGWAILEKGPQLIASGVIRCHRAKDEEFQQYRLRLEARSQLVFEDLIELYHPTQTTNEIIPAVGGGNFVVATQSYLANCVVTTLHDCAFRHRLAAEQISARTVQSKIGIKGRTGKVSKVGMRNGVLIHFPELRVNIADKDDWPWDRWDGIGIGLAAIGYSTYSK